MFRNLRLTTKKLLLYLNFFLIFFFLLTATELQQAAAALMKDFSKTNRLESPVGPCVFMRRAVGQGDSAPRHGWNRSRTDPLPAVCPVVDALVPPATPVKRLLRRQRLHLQSSWRSSGGETGPLPDICSSCHTQPPGGRRECCSPGGWSWFSRPLLRGLGLDANTVSERVAVHSA